MTLFPAFPNLANLIRLLDVIFLTENQQLLLRSMIKLPRFSRSLTALALSLVAAGSLNAQNYIENGDAGSNLATAQATGMGGGALNTISGTIISAFDGDFYYITLANPGIFSASTVGNGNTLDTLLYLFTAAGNPIYLNDDAPGGNSVGSTLPAGTSFTMNLAAGTYIIGISLSGAEPINAANQQLFADGVFSTDIRGPRAGALGPVTGVTQATFPGSGAYVITLTGATMSAVPEPSSVVLLACSGIGALIMLRRRTRRS